MNIKFTKKFVKLYAKAPLKIHKAFDNRFLHNHALIGKYSQYRSINITGDWRAIYYASLENQEEIIIFIAIGTHSQLYE